MKTPPIPEKIDVIQKGMEMVIRRRWLSWAVIPLLIFCIAWDSFLFFWYSTALKSSDTPLFAILFPIGHVSVGIGLTYYVIASFLNKTDVILSPTEVKVSTYPLPWGFTKVVHREDLMAVRAKHSSQTNGRSSYGIRYTNRSNREKSLIRGGLNDDQAEFIEYHLRRNFGLRDDE